jgi:hypothetical protein
MTLPFLPRRCGVVAFIALAVLTRASDASADDRPATSGFYADLGAGPAFATYRPIDSQGTVPEHLVSTGSQLTIGAGHGFDAGPLRIDVGLRLHHLRLAAFGSYSIDERDDEFRANYDFVAPMASGSLATRFGTRVNGFVGLTLGVAALFTDPKGRTRNTELIPIYGTFEGGLLVRLTEGLDARAGLSWTPPVDQIHVLSPQLGLRARF